MNEGERGIEQRREEEIERRGKEREHEGEREGGKRREKRMKESELVSGREILPEL
jgi:hypothetical protein